MSDMRSFTHQQSSRGGPHKLLRRVPIFDTRFPTSGVVLIPLLGQNATVGQISSGLNG